MEQKENYYKQLVRNNIIYKEMIKGFKDTIRKQDNKIKELKLEIKSYKDRIEYLKNIIYDNEE